MAASTRRTITQGQLDKIERLRRQGMSQRQIAKAACCSRSTVSRHLESIGLSGSPDGEAQADNPIDDALNRIVMGQDGMNEDKRMTDKPSGIAGAEPLPTSVGSSAEAIAFGLLSSAEEYDIGQAFPKELKVAEPVPELMEYRPGQMERPTELVSVPLRDEMIDLLRQARNLATRLPDPDQGIALESTIITALNVCELVSWDE